MIRDIINGKKKALRGELESVGIGGFKLFAQVNESINYKSTVPTQILEDGSSVSDDIIRDPITVNIIGTVGDRHIEIESLPVAVLGVNDTINDISIMLPNRTQSQLNRIKSIGVSVMDAADKVDKYINIGKSAYSLVSGGETSKPLQEKFIDFIEAVYFGNQLIDVSTSNRTITNMAITNLEIRKNSGINQSDFEITLVKVETVGAIYTDISKFYKKPAGNFSNATAGEVQKGAQNPSTGVNKSLLSAILGR